MTIYSLVIPPNFEPVICSISGSSCCFLTCIQVSQETGTVVWYSHLFKNFPWFVDINTVKKALAVNEVESTCFSGILLLSPGSNECWQFNLRFLCIFWTQLVHLEFLVHVVLKPSLSDFDHDLASIWNELNRTVVCMFFGVAFLWIALSPIFS